MSQEKGAHKYDRLPFGKEGVPYRLERVLHPELGWGGVYGAWGDQISNEALTTFLNNRLGRPVQEVLPLSDFGFNFRYHGPNLSQGEHHALEVSLGGRYLKAAAAASGWRPEEVDAVLIGSTAPVTPDFTVQIAKAAGIADSALKVSVHAACDSSVRALHLALNPDLGLNGELDENLAKRLLGKRVLVGGFEGLSRFLYESQDEQALQLFGNAAAVLGVIPGVTMQFLVGSQLDVFDDKGSLAVRMHYPYSGSYKPGQPMMEVTRDGENHIRIAGIIPEPQHEGPVDMSGQTDMVKLFVRSGVTNISRAYAKYRELMSYLGQTAREIAAVSVHHANFKINSSKVRRLERDGINLPYTWELSDFGNVSAASNMIAFLRMLPRLKVRDHVLFDGFGAGAYFDAIVVELGANQHA